MRLNTAGQDFFFQDWLIIFLLHLATLSLSNLDNNESENQLFSCCIIRPTGIQNVKTTDFWCLLRCFKLQSSWKFWDCESLTTNPKIFIKLILSTLFNSYHLSKISLLKKEGKRLRKIKFPFISGKNVTQKLYENKSEQMCQIV